MERENMYTAILLDGTKNPVSIRLSRRDTHSEQMNYPPGSIQWSGAATKLARSFNFIQEVIRDKDVPIAKEVRIYALVGLAINSLVHGLRDDDGRPLTLKRQGEIMASDFLYPEKYQEMASN